MAITNKREILKNLILNIPIKDGFPEYIYPDNPNMPHVHICYSHKKFLDLPVIADFIGMAVIDFFKKSEYYEKGADIKDNTLISDLDKLKIDELVDQIDAHIESLPREYEFIFPIPKLEWKEDSISLKHNVTITNITDQFLTDHQKAVVDTSSLSIAALKERLANEFYPKHNKYSLGDTVMKIKIKGYVSKFGEIIKNDSDPLYIFKIVLSFLDIYGAFYLDYSHGKLPQPYKYDVIDIDDKKIITTLNESIDDYKFVINRKFDIYKDSSKTRRFVDILDILPKLLNETKKPITQLKNLRIGIINALYWLFEIEKTNNVHLKAIFIATAMDSFFVGSDTDKSKVEQMVGLVFPDIHKQVDAQKHILKLLGYRNAIVHGEIQVDSTNNNGLLSTSEDNIFTITNYCQYYLRLFIKNRVLLYIGSIK